MAKGNKPASLVEEINRGQTLAIAEERARKASGTGSALVVANPAAVVESLDSTWLDGIDVERIVTLADGQGIRGIFRGAGPLAEINDPVTGEVRGIKTWRIEVRPGLVARLLGGCRLDQEFGARSPGVRVRVARLGQVETRRNRRVTDYLVADERAPLPA